MVCAEDQGTTHSAAPDLALHDWVALWIHCSRLFCPSAPCHTVPCHFVFVVDTAGGGRTVAVLQARNVGRSITTSATQFSDWIKVRGWRYVVFKPAAFALMCQSLERRIMMLEWLVPRCYVETHPTVLHTVLPSVLRGTRRPHHEPVPWYVALTPDRVTCCVNCTFAGLPVLTVRGPQLRRAPHHIRFTQRPAFQPIRLSPGVTLGTQEGAARSTSRSAACTAHAPALICPFQPPAPRRGLIAV